MAEQKTIASQIGVGKKYEGVKPRSGETTGQALWKYYERLKRKLTEGDKNG
jgi:hypothetical protein